MTQNSPDCSSSVQLTTNMRKNRLRILVGSLFVMALCGVVRYYWGAEPASAEPAIEAARRSTAETESPVRKAAARPSTQAKVVESKARPASAEKAAAASSAPAIVATVNTKRINREDLARECRRRYGKEVLESMVNKYLITQECKRLGVSVTRAEVDAEIERMAKRFGIPVDQWLKMLKQERNITPTQYSNDIIWPTLALRKLAGERLAVSREELEKEFDIQYGEAVKARLIAVADLEKAKKLRAEAAANPDEFGNLAKTYSEDAPSASAKGVIQPIRKHGSYEEIEEAVFNMEDGDVSPVIHAGGQYVILKREKLLPARQVSFEDVAPKLEEILRERKLRPVSQDVFQQLQTNAKVENVWNDPEKHAKMPGVAATINGAPIPVSALDDECIVRHGTDTLDGMIKRSLLEQACKKQNITVTEQDIDAEIARAALAGTRPKQDGSPDIEAWLELIVKKQGIPIDTYRNDIVWPSAALKMLVGDKIEVTDEDLQKGYEANYGPRVRCLAIVLDNQRRAQQVFELARKDNTSDNFGKLAEEYSVEPGSKAMRGEVPPIKKHGGQPKLEEEAFQLKPGELSGVIQVADKFIILRCEEYTKPTSNIAFDTVRDDIYEDLYEKKLRLAMADRFEELQESAVIDNYLAGTSHTPNEKREGSAAKVPSLRQVPGK